MECFFSGRIDLKKLHEHDGLPATYVLPFNVVRIRAQRLPALHAKAVNELRQQRFLSASRRDRLRPSDDNHDPQHSEQVHNQGPLIRDRLLL